MRPRIGCACLMVVLSAATTSAPAQASMERLEGAAAWAALAGNTVTGATADGDYTDYYATDGNAVHVDKDGREVGHWSLKDDRVCFSYPTDPDEQVECRRIEVEGTHGAFIDIDGSRYRFDILPGDAKRL